MPLDGPAINKMPDVALPLKRDKNIESDPRPRSRLARNARLGVSASGLGYGHHFQQMAVRILEIETAPAATCV